MPTLETERLNLRDFALSDWDTLNAIVTDPAVTLYMHFASWDEEKRRQWLARIAQDASNPHPWHDNWAITLRGTGQLIGWLFIGASRDVAEQGTRGCGYALDQRFWGQGYMTEALRAAFAYEFTVLGTQEIIAECDTPNTASARHGENWHGLPGDVLRRRLRGHLGGASSLLDHRASVGDVLTLRSLRSLRSLRFLRVEPRRPRRFLHPC